MNKEKEEEDVDLISLVSYIVKKAHDEGVRQIGKTFVQKISYLVARKLKTDFGHTMYYYGPFSSDIEGAISLAKGLQQINVEWRDGEGFFIEPRQTEWADRLPDEVKNVVDRVLDRFAKRSAVELSIITSAFYIMDHFNIPEEKVVDAILRMKPEHDKDWVRRVLKKAEVIT